uniref:Uncharacterized protein n=1 Tax=Anguilla anguilla TaxID=7936 RepID=A0A0E9VUS9_ANGAN
MRLTHPLFYILSPLITQGWRLIQEYSNWRLKDTSQTFSTEP